LKRSQVGLLAAFLLAFCMWFYVQHVLIPHQVAEATRLAEPRGNLSDLYPRWLGTKELLLHHRDPYGSDVTREIQEGYYGRALDLDRPNDPQDQQGFAYPVYVVFLLAPFVHLPFAAVEIVFRWLLMLATVASVLLWLRALRWQPPLATIATIVLLCAGSFPVLQGLKLQQLTLLVAPMIAGSVTLLSKKPFLSGCILALGAIKPQLVLPLAAWLLLWAISDLRRRQKWVWGFAGTLGLLCAAGEYVLPGWFGRFQVGLVAYRQYTDGAESILEVLLGTFWGRLLMALIVLGVAGLCWRLRKMTLDSPPVQAVIALILSATVVIAPKTAPYNQVLLLPPILFLVRSWSEIFRARTRRAVAVGVACLVVWPWAAALGLMLACLFLPASSVQHAWALPLYPSLMIPPAIMLLVILYFMGPLESGATEA